MTPGLALAAKNPGELIWRNNQLKMKNEITHTITTYVATFGLFDVASMKASVIKQKEYLSKPSGRTLRFDTTEGSIVMGIEEVKAIYSMPVAQFIEYSRRLDAEE